MDILLRSFVYVLIFIGFILGGSFSQVSNELQSHHNRLDLETASRATTSLTNYVFLKSVRTNSHQQNLNDKEIKSTKRDLTDVNRIQTYKKTLKLIFESEKKIPKELCREDYCRVAGRCLPENLFAFHTCSLCYSFMPLRLFHKKLNVQPKTYFVKQKSYSLLALSNGTHLFDADIRSKNDEILVSFSSGVEKWKNCCLKATDCCMEMKSLQHQSPLGFCPRTWDGWQCWDDTQNGTSSYQKCPEYIYFFSQPPSCTASASKKCLDSGEWSVNSEGRERSNYSSCSVVKYFELRFEIQLVAHFISILFLLPAIAIFFHYNQLKVPRVSMHKNFFISLLINSSLVFSFKSFVLLQEEKLGLIKTNSPICITLLVGIKLSRMSNYMWMFCEAFFLHKLVTSSFAEQKSLRIYYLIGWFFPIVLVSVYVWLRLEDKMCWVVPAEPYEWVLNIPCLLALMINGCFMIDIMRVLMTKLRANNARQPSQGRKAVKATMVLMPLFGLHLFFMMYRPISVACEWTELYHYMNSIIDGLQGFLVAVAFCFANHEIRHLVGRSFYQWREVREVRPTVHQHNTIVSSLDKESFDESRRNSMNIFRFYNRLRKSSQDSKIVKFFTHKKGGEVEILNKDLGLNVSQAIEIQLQNEKDEKNREDFGELSQQPSGGPKDATKDDTFDHRPAGFEFQDQTVKVASDPFMENQNKPNVNFTPDFEVIQTGFLDDGNVILPSDGGTKTNKLKVFEPSSDQSSIIVNDLQLSTFKIMTNETEQNTNSALKETHSAPSLVAKENDYQCRSHSSQDLFC